MSQAVNSSSNTSALSSSPTSALTKYILHSAKCLCPNHHGNELSAIVPLGSQVALGTDSAGSTQYSGALAYLHDRHDGCGDAAAHYVHSDRSGVGRHNRQEVESIFPNYGGFCKERSWVTGVLQVPPELGGHLEAGSREESDLRAWLNSTPSVSTTLLRLQHAAGDVHLYKVDNLNETTGKHTWDDIMSLQPAETRPAYSLQACCDMIDALPVTRLAPTFSPSERPPEDLNHDEFISLYNAAMSMPTTLAALSRAGRPPLLSRATGMLRMASEQEPGATSTQGRWRSRTSARIYRLFHPDSEQ